MPIRCEAASWARGWVVPRLQKEAGQAPADERDPSCAGPPAACHAALLTSKFDVSNAAWQAAGGPARLGSRSSAGAWPASFWRRGTTQPRAQLAASHLIGIALLRYGLELESPSPRPAS